MTWRKKGGKVEHEGFGGVVGERKPMGLDFGGDISEKLPNEKKG